MKENKQPEYIFFYHHKHDMSLIGSFPGTEEEFDTYMKACEYNKNDFHVMQVRRPKLENT